MLPARINKDTNEKSYQGLSLREEEKALLSKSNDLPMPTEMRRIAFYILSITGYDDAARLDELTSKIKKDDDLKNKIQKAKNFIKLKRNYLCVITGKKVTNLDAHHFYPVASHPKLATNQNNLIPINQSLHRTYHKWATLNEKGEQGLGDYKSFWEFLENHYKKNKIKNNIQNIKSQFPDPLNDL